MWRNPQGKEGAPGGLLTPCLIPPLSHPTFNQVALLLPVFCVRIRNETSLQKRVLPLFLKRVKENGSIRLIRWRFAEVSGVPEGTRLEPAWSPHTDHRSPPRFYWLQDGDAERRTVNTPGDAQRGPEAQTPQGRHPGPWGPPSVSPRAGVGALVTPTPGRGVPQGSRPGNKGGLTSPVLGASTERGPLGPEGLNYLRPRPPPPPEGPDPH